MLTTQCSAVLARPAGRRGGRRSRSRSPDWRWQQGWQRLEEGGEREGAVRLLARAAGASGGGGVFDRLAAAPPGSVFDRLAPAAEGGAGQRRASVFDRMNPGGGQGGVLSRLRVNAAASSPLPPPLPLHSKPDIRPAPVLCIIKYKRY